MGTNTVSGAKKTGGSTTTSSTSTSGTIGATTLTISTIPSHNHSVQYTAGTLNYPKGGMTGGDTHNRYINTNNTGNSNSHTHSLSSTSHTHTITPPYYTLIFCVKLP